METETQCDTGGEGLGAMSVEDSIRQTTRRTVFRDQHGEHELASHFTHQPGLRDGSQQEEDWE